MQSAWQHHRSLDYSLRAYLYMHHRHEKMEGSTLMNMTIIQQGESCYERISRSFKQGHLRFSIFAPRFARSSFGTMHDAGREIQLPLIFRG